MIMPRLAMRLFSLDEEYGHHRKREIDDRLNPKRPPVSHHLPQSCAELIDANDAVDGEIRRKDIADDLRGLGDRFGYLNHAPAAWPMKLVAKVNTDTKANNCRGSPSVEKP